MKENGISAVENLNTQTEAVNGRLDGVDDDGRVLFRPQGESESVPVAIGLPIGDAEVVKAAWLGQRALVVKTQGSGSQLVLIGFLRERVGAATRDAAPDELEVQVKGECLRLTGKQRIELVCGKSRIVLDRNGNIEINGVRLVQRARGPIKIKGSTIDLN